MKKIVIGILTLLILVGVWRWADSHYSSFCRMLAGCRFNALFKEAAITPLNRSVKIDQTYYITLQRDPRRISHVQSELTRLDIPQPIEMFAAIDGLQFNNEDIKAMQTANLFTEKAVKKLRKGEFGCAMSHRALWQKVAEDPAIEVALILEDDVELIPHFNEQWEKISSQIPEDFDMVYLYN
jgi:GR25 family glycosyltransferase involved in LPS biosynthesis